MPIVLHRSGAASLNPASPNSNRGLNQRWPLHPQPHDYETLERWLERLAAEYRVPLKTFYTQALGLRREEFALMRVNPPDEALRRLAVGTGVPIQNLREMDAQRTWQRMMAELNRLYREEPEAFAELERMTVRGSFTGQTDLPTSRSTAPSSRRLR